MGDVTKLDTRLHILRGGSKVEESQPPSPPLPSTLCLGQNAAQLQVHVSPTVVTQMAQDGQYQQVHSDLLQQLLNCNDIMTVLGVIRQHECPTRYSLPH